MKLGPSSKTLATPSDTAHNVAMLKELRKQTVQKARTGRVSNFGSRPADVAAEKRLADLAAFQVASNSICITVTSNNEAPARNFSKELMALADAT